ncbi:thiamine pyrophosphokinase Thi80 [Infundibulicybe gibba]|nr:thiamine pyrophosphokinase Thi80 [Infundibulicybe gibba]
MGAVQSTKLTSWHIDFLGATDWTPERPNTKRALVILNQPFSAALLRRVWNATSWHCCADGGANRLRAIAPDASYIPDMIKGDLDSLKHDVETYYTSQGVSIVKDDDQDSTDLMKCVSEIENMEKEAGDGVSLQYEIILLGGLSGRLDQTIHTLSYLHKLRKTRERVFTVTDDNLGWVLTTGKHEIHIDHHLMGKTCGLLPVGVAETQLTTSGLKWNLTNAKSSFDGLVSTSNHLIPEENVVYVETTQPIWWTVELKNL